MLPGTGTGRESKDSSTLMGLQGGVLSASFQLQHLSIMPVLLLSLQEEEDDVLGAARQLLAKFKISGHLKFFQFEES